MKMIYPAVALLALLAACKPPAQGDASGSEHGNNLDAAPAKTTTIPVKTVVAQQGSLSAARSVSAIISAQKDSRVAADTGGTVKDWLVNEGEQVGAGQAVLQLDDTTQQQALENAQVQLKQAQINLQQARSTALRADPSLSAAVRSAQAALAQAQANAASTENLYSLGGVSQAEVQAARSQLAQAQSALASAQQNLAQNGKSAQNSVPLQQATLEAAQVGVRQAQQNLNRTVVRAPFSGTVADQLVKEGEYAAPGSAVFRLVDTANLRLKFSVPAPDARALPAGTAFNVTYGGRNYVGRVTDSSGIAGTDRLVPVTARIEGGNLPVGGTAQARYRTTLGSGAVVPSSAVQASGAGNAVYVVKEGRAVRRSVSVVAEASGKVALSDLPSGTPVISPLPGGLQDGAKVTVTP